MKTLQQSYHRPVWGHFLRHWTIRGVWGMGWPEAKTR